MEGTVFTVYQTQSTQSTSSTICSHHQSRGIFNQDENHDLTLKRWPAPQPTAEAQLLVGLSGLCLASRTTNRMAPRGSDRLSFPCGETNETLSPFLANSIGIGAKVRA